MKTFSKIKVNLRLIVLNLGFENMGSAVTVSDDN